MGEGIADREDQSSKSKEGLGVENVKEPVLSNHLALNIIKGGKKVIGDLEKLQPIIKEHPAY